MAVPTITTVSQVTGTPTGGQAVEILGTNFRLPSTPPVTGGVSPTLPAPVQVFFGGVEATKVAVLTDTRLYAITPVRVLPFDSQGKTLGSEVVSIQLSNVDDDGIPIPGESATAVDAYTYKRPGITHGESGDFLRVTSLLLDTLRSQVLANTVLETSVDFDPDTGTPVIDISELPALVIDGPRLSFNTFFTYRGTTPVPGKNANEVFAQRRNRVVDISYSVMGITDSSVEIINLIQLIELVIDRNVDLRLPLDASNPSSGYLPLEMSFVQDPEYVRTSAELGSDIRTFSGAILLKGYPLNTFIGVENDNVQDFAATVNTISLADAEQTGENNPTTQGASTRSPPDTSTAPPTTPHGVTTRSPSETSTAPPTAPPQGASTRSPPDQPISEPPTLPPQGVTRRSPPDAEDQP